MAMTCCDMNDQTQGTDFLPLSPSFDTSDFFFFSTVANNCKVSSAQRKNVQHHLSQTVSPNRSASVTTSVQQSFKVAHRNSSDTWLSSLPCNTSATPLKVAFKPASANNTSPLSPVNYEAALPQQLHPPAPPHRKLAQILFRSPGVGVGCSHHVITAPSTDASFAAKPNLTSKPTSLLQRLVRRHLAHHSAAQQVSMTAESCSSASEADLYFSTMRPDPINSSSALLHKLLQTQHGWKEWFGEQPDVG